MSDDVTISVSREEHAEMGRLKAMERFVSSLFDDWIDGCSELMALYPDLGWDEVLALAVEEITEARGEVAV